ncbi:MAG TPA: YARHG domain-containing protein [Pyrinomonadaceae bacterium]
MWRSSRSILRSSFLALILFAIGSSLSVAQAQDNLSQWEKFDFAARSVQLAEIKDLSLDDLKFLRGIVFGRHGRVFKDAYIQSYLKERAWYRPNPDFQNSLLNETERRNLDVIREAEAAQHENIQPGDLRFYQNRLFTARKLGEHTGAEWRVLRAEIEAIHGKRFDEEPWLQQYFEERYWYAPDSQYDSKRLTAIEKKNLETIIAAQKKQRHVSVSPGDMELFQNTTLKEEMLAGLSLHELRLMRNEFYARHGRTFNAMWLQQHFDFQPWYRALEEGQQPAELSEIEKLNVEAILRVEKRLREELSTKAIPRQVLEGLFIEDARKLRDEIYARHGKIFKDRNIQKYFASFDWYTPDPKFSERSLNKIERRNYATILAYERKATSMMDVIEG